MNGFIELDRLRSREELDMLATAAKQENHGVFFPTHPLRKDGETVGYFSIAPPGAVQVFAWLAKEVCSRESFHLINTVENLVRGGGGMVVCFPVPKNSPFHPLMEGMGYRNHGTYDFFVKEL